MWCRPGECIGELELCDSNKSLRAHDFGRTKVTDNEHRRLVSVIATTRLCSSAQSSSGDGLSVGGAAVEMLMVGRDTFRHHLQPSFRPLMHTLQHRKDLLRHCYMCSDWSDDHLTLFAYWMSELKLLNVRAGPQPSRCCSLSC